MQVSNETPQSEMINLHVAVDEVPRTGTHPVALDASRVEVNATNMVVGTHPGEQVPPADVKATPGERAQGLIRGLCLVLHHHGITRNAMDSFRTQATAYLTVPEEAVFFKRAKYLTVVPMAHYLGPDHVDPPSVPDVDWIPSGQYRNWAKRRMGVFCRKNTHLWYSFLQGKRAALPLSDDLVLTTYEEHRKAMEIKDPIDNDIHDRCMKELKPVLDQIKRGLQQEYSTAGREADWLAPGETQHVASTKASFEKSRAAGGQLGALIRKVPELYRCNPLAGVKIRQDPELIRMCFFPRAIVSGRVCLNVLIEEFGYPDGERSWYESIRKESVYFAKEQRILKATIQAVLEPLKVRVISKGNAAPYYISKRLQKALHTVMRGMDCFRLIGAPLGAVDLIDLAMNKVQTGTGQYEWFSIDYSAATDRLSARLSASILHYLVEGQDLAMQNVWKAVLAPHFCKYPFPYDKAVPAVQQVNGQLMGSILSFPILCLANLALYLTTVQEDTRSLRDKLKGVLVNGDDMLYVAPSDLWKVHVQNGKRVGLTMSPGKAYHHPVYANANSACYHFDLRQFKTVSHRQLTGMRRSNGVPTPVWSVSSSIAPRSSVPFSIPFLNTGLYFGQNKVLGGDDHDVEKSFSSTINRLVQGALPGKAAGLLAMFLNRHKAEVQRETYGRNLFLPQSLGGMGVNPVEGFTSTKVTLAQRVLARQLIEENPFATMDQAPLGSEHFGFLPEAPQPLRAPWLANLAFTQDEEGDWSVVEKEAHHAPLDLRLAYLRRKRDLSQLPMASNAMLRFGLTISSTKRLGSVYRHRPPTPNMFEVRTRRDRLLALLEDYSTAVQSD